MKRAIVALLAAAAVLIGCVSAPPAETPAQQIAYAQGSLEAMTTTAAVLVERGALSVEEAVAFRAKLDEATAALRLARMTLGQNQATTTLEHLRTVNMLLLELDTMLNTGERPHGP